MNELIKELEKQEPVAWMLDFIDDGFEVKDFVVTKLEYIGAGYNVRPLYIAPPQTEKQEPVAWMYEIFGDKVLTSNAKKIDLVLANGKTVTPLYNAPPRKEWVGLTDAQISLIISTHKSLTDLCRAIEAKLKEKNGAL
jgi:hypothetical protein